MRISDQLIHKCGAAALIVGGILGAISHLMHPWMPPTTQAALASYAHTTARAHILLLFAVIFSGLGLPALFARLRKNTGLLLFSSMPLIFVGLVLFDLLHCPIEIGLVPLLPSLDYDTATRLIGGIYGPPSPYFWINIAGMPLLILGLIFLIAGTWHSSALPRWPQLLLACVPVLIAASFLPLQNATPIVAEHAFPVFLYAGFTSYGVVQLISPDERSPY